MANRVHATSWTRPRLIDGARVQLTLVLLASEHLHAHVMRWLCRRSIWCLVRKYRSIDRDGALYHSQICRRIARVPACQTISSRREDDDTRVGRRRSPLASSSQPDEEDPANTRDLLASASRAGQVRRAPVSHLRAGDDSEIAANLNTLTNLINGLAIVQVYQFQVHLPAYSAPRAPTSLRAPRTRRSDAHAADPSPVSVLVALATTKARAYHAAHG